MRLCIFALVLLFVQSAYALEPQDPAFGGYQINPEYYQELVRDGYIPTRPEMSDVELSDKLNLNLPQLAQVKSALEKKDATALQAALGAYLNSRLTPARVAETGKPAANAAEADKWLASEIVLQKTVIDGRPPKSWPVGEHIDWFQGAKGCETTIFCDWYFAPTLAEAYQSSGDPRYAQRLLILARDFYPTAGRPPAQRPVTWYGCGGPWRSQGLHTRLSYLAVAYRAIGASPLVTDADRVMFLKMFWEHCDALYQITDRHQPRNFAFCILVLLDNAIIFPEFLDSPTWVERCNVRFHDMLRDMVLDDGGTMERTGYGYGVIMSLERFYSRLREAGVTQSEPDRQRLEKASEFTALYATPTLLYPLFGHGTPTSMQGHIERGAALFPERDDIAFVASGGTKGKPPTRTAHDFWQMGFALMRSDWSQDALYMALDYNGSPWGEAEHPELLGFALQSDRRLYMTSPGSVRNYGTPDEANWSRQTIAANTVAVDHEPQKTVDNGGWLQNWETMPGFDYLAAVSRGYEFMGVRHRRAVLFMKPLARAQQRHGYWMLYDRLDGNGRPHEYRWMGHFQPTELKVDVFRKTVETSAEDGNRLYLMSAEPYSHFGLEQGSGLIQGVKGQGGSELSQGPYIALVRPSADPVAFKVLLYPATSKDAAPVLEALPARDGDRPTGEIPHQEACSPRRTEEAVGFRITQGTYEDIIALAQSPALRTYGRWGHPLLTDGEAAYVRRDNGQILETGLVRGRRLIYESQPLIEAAPEIASVNVRYTNEKVEIQTHGVGKLSIAQLSAREVTLNGKPVSVIVTNGMMKIKSQQVLKMTLSAPAFSTDPSVLCRAVGITYGPDVGPNAFGSYNKPPENSVVVTWQSSLPSDREVEYREAKSKTWERSVHGELLTNHRFVLSGIKPGKKYEFKITCRSEEGALGSVTTAYMAPQKRRP